MPDTASIYRRVLVDDGFGGVNQTGVVKASGPHPARFAQAQVIQTPALARDLEVETWTVRFPWGTDLRDEDLVLWHETGIVVRVTDLKPRSFQTATSAAGEVIKGLDLGVSE